MSVHNVSRCQVEYGRSACRNLEVYGEDGNGKKYCVLHFPSKEKDPESFNREIDKKIQWNIFNFHGVWFPDFVSVFRECKFGRRADFRHAKFIEGADFTGAQFHLALFSQANFGKETEKGTHFVGATFDDRADFRKVVFGGRKTDFSGGKFVYKDEPDFSGAEFYGLTNFDRVIFKSGATFSETKFYGEGVSFGSAEFKEGKAIFDGAKFFCEQGTRNREVRYSNTKFHEGVSFEDALFCEEVSFSEALFGKQTNFQKVSFRKKGNFSKAIFTGSVRFSSAEEDNVFPIGAREDGEYIQRLSLWKAQPEKANRFVFENTTLRPSWFIDIDDLDSFQFDSVEWHGLRKRWRIGKVITDDMKISESTVWQSSLRLEKVCSKLANRAENENDPVQAAAFRYWAQEVRRKEKWYGFFMPWRLSWWYWAASGYGERPAHAFFVLVLAWLAFAILYTWIGFDPTASSVTSGESCTDTLGHYWENLQQNTGQALWALWPSFEHLGQALSWSLGVMARLNQGPTLPTKEAVGCFQFFVFMEGLLGPLQIALLLLAIRRRLQLEGSSPS